MRYLSILTLVCDRGTGSGMAGAKMLNQGWSM